MTLNVGGTLFRTTRTTLTMDPNSMLAALASGEWSSTTDETGAILLDRDPAFFGPILNWLRSSKLIISPSISYKGVLEEAKFFDLPSLVALLSPLVDASKPRPAPSTAYATVTHAQKSHDSMYEYSVYPIHVQGPVEPGVLTHLNGGSYPPPERVFPASAVYGDPDAGWYVKNHSLADVFNVLAAWQWDMVSSSGDGSGGSWGSLSHHCFVFSKSTPAPLTQAIADAIEAARIDQQVDDGGDGDGGEQRVRGRRRDGRRRRRRDGGVDRVSMASRSVPVHGLEVVTITDDDAVTTTTTDHDDANDLSSSSCSST